MHPLSRHALLVAAFALGTGAFAAAPAHASAQVALAPPPAPTPVDDKAKTEQEPASGSATAVDPPSLPTPAPASVPTPAPAPQDKGDAPATRNQHHNHLVCGPPYVLGNPNLGPKYLPKHGFLGKILKGYVRYGGLPPQSFLFRYFNEQINNWRYPDEFGFAKLAGWPNARPLSFPKKLPVGLKLDRFGGNNGSFLSPLGAPFISRALPPSNLNTNFQFAPDYICNYHAFKVSKSFTADVGPASRAFQMPGKGKQIHTMAKYIPGAPANQDGEVAISWLIDNGYLTPLN